MYQKCTLPHNKEVGTPTPGGSLRNLRGSTVQNHEGGTPYKIFRRVRCTDLKSDNKCNHKMFWRVRATLLSRSACYSYVRPDFYFVVV